MNYGINKQHIKTRYFEVSPAKRSVRKTRIVRQERLNVLGTRNAFDIELGTRRAARQDTITLFIRNHRNVRNLFHGDSVRFCEKCMLTFCLRFQHLWQAWARLEGEDGRRAGLV
jgi:hypothetical protein